MGCLNHVIHPSADVETNDHVRKVHHTNEMSRDDDGNNHGLMLAMCALLFSSAVFWFLFLFQMIYLLDTE